MQIQLGSPEEPARREHILKDEPLYFSLAKEYFSVKPRDRARKFMLYSYELKKGVWKPGGVVVEWNKHTDRESIYQAPEVVFPETSWADLTAGAWPGEAVLLIQLDERGIPSAAVLNLAGETFRLAWRGEENIDEDLPYGKLIQLGVGPTPTVEEVKEAVQELFKEESFKGNPASASKEVAEEFHRALEEAREESPFASLMEMAPELYYHSLKAKKKDVPIVP